MNRYSIPLDEPTAMPADAVKSLVNYLRNKIAYPRSRIGFGSRVAGQTALGANVVIGRRCYVFESSLADNVQVFDDCRVFDSRMDKFVAIYPWTTLNKVQSGGFSYIAEQSQAAGLTLGRFCSIGPYFLCGYGDHPTDRISTAPVFFSTKRQCGISFADKDSFAETCQTTIGNDVWIGARVFVKDGVRIGDGAIVGAGAVVVKDVPSYAVVGGVPAKVIRYRFAGDVIRELLEIQWWNWSEEKIRQAQPLLAQADVKSFLDWARQS
jgi:acetyltransferase-like isoleucine patch superfamily enzyme